MSVRKWEAMGDWERVDMTPTPADLDYDPDSFGCVAVTIEDGTPPRIEDPADETVIFFEPSEGDDETNADRSIAAGKSIVVDPAHYA